MVSIEGLSGDIDHLWGKKESGYIEGNPFYVPFYVKSFFIEGDISSAIYNNTFNLDLYSSLVKFII